MQFADESQRVAGEQLASMGASGNVVSEGANLAVQKEQARQAEIQDFIIGYQGLQEKKRLEQEAVNYDILKNQYRRRGRNTLGAGILSGIGTMLKG
jgi:hypothetical protein